MAGLVQKLVRGGAAVAVCGGRRAGDAGPDAHGRVDLAPPLHPPPSQAAGGSLLSWATPAACSGAQGMLQQLRGFASEGERGVPLPGAPWATLLACPPPPRACAATLVPRLRRLCAPCGPARAPGGCGSPR